MALANGLVDQAVVPLEYGTEPPPLLVGHVAEVSRLRVAQEIVSDRNRGPGIG